MTPAQQNTIGLLIRATGDVELYRAFTKTCDRARGIVESVDEFGNVCLTTDNGTVYGRSRIAAEANLEASKL